MVIFKIESRNCLVISFLSTVFCFRENFRTCKKYLGYIYDGKKYFLSTQEKFQGKPRNYFNIGGWTYNSSTTIQESSYYRNIWWNPFFEISWLPCFSRSLRGFYFLKDHDFHVLTGVWDHFDDLCCVEEIFIWSIYYKNILFFRKKI